MKKLTLLLSFFPLFALAQQNGIHFEHDVSWAEIQTKAKAENKFIFMDCFTTWCGPCHYMSENIFPLDEVGNFMNEKFISVAAQLDTTGADNDEVKSWYQDAHDIAEKNKVRAYPTYLFFDPNGVVVHRSVGAGPADEFLAKAKNALNPETQYYTLLNKYQSGQKDSAFLHKLALAAMDAYDLDNGKLIANEYLKTQPDLYTKSNLEFIENFTQTSNDKGFTMMLKNPAKVDAVLGQYVAENMVQNIIMREEIFRRFPESPTEKPDWMNISAAITKKYPAQAPEAMAKAKVIWYQHVKDWKSFETAVTSYMKKYNTHLSPEELNQYAWMVFQNCNDINCVQQALEWSKKSFEDNNNPAFMDTYANILYKLGRKEEAISWEQKSIDLAPETDKKSYQETIDKMKAGEKTWD